MPSRTARESLRTWPHRCLRDCRWIREAPVDSRSALPGNTGHAFSSVVANRYDIIEWLLERTRSDASSAVKPISMPCVRPLPQSRSGFTVDGLLPALKYLEVIACQVARNNPSAICERAELPVQRISTRCFIINAPFISRGIKSNCSAANNSAAPLDQHGVAPLALPGAIRSCRPIRSRRPTCRKPWRACRCRLAVFSGKILLCSVQIPCASDTSISATSSADPTPRPAAALAT